MNFKEQTHSFTQRPWTKDFHLSELSIDPLLSIALKELYPEQVIEGGRTRIRLVQESSVLSEGYRIEFDDITAIHASSHAGFLYGMMALIQLAQERTSIDIASITDYPNLSFRGYMLDISRNKIPTQEEIKRWLRLCALARLNHFELYVEGFSFLYESFGNLPFETPITKEEFVVLQEYASLLSIDLVPNMNSFGHMTEWLALPKYQSLSEKEDGFDIWGYHFPPSTLNPLDKASVQHVLQMISELAVVSKGSYFHVNMDEPFELGQGKSKEECEKTSKAKVYLDFQNQIFTWLKEHKLTPLFWADVLIHHPEVFDLIDKNAIVCDWGYDFDYPYEEHAKALEQHQLRYVLCPGTSSWNSILSRRRDMLATLNNAITAAKNHHGLGLLMTDWGDFGHLQASLFSYPAVLLTGIQCWGEDWQEEEIEAFLNKYYFSGESLYDIVKQLSSYSTLENKYVYNSTMAFQSIMHVDPSFDRDNATKLAILKNAVAQNFISAISLTQIRELLDNCEIELPKTGSSLTDEIRYSIGLIRIFLAVNEALSMNSRFQEKDRNLLKWSIKEHDRLWLIKNRKGGIEKSLRRLQVLLEIMDEHNRQVMI